MRAIATRICVLPKPYGYLRKGQPVALDIEAWDVKKYPWLKHLENQDKPAEAPKDPKGGKKDDGFLK